jgi:uncharacterized protein (TIGR03437 family)
MAAIVLLAALALGPIEADSSGTSGSPTYTAASIANSASATAGPYAPNTLVTIYGQNLASVTRALSSADIRAGMLPTALIGTGVLVLINQIPADIYYVSPGQVNILIPTILVAGPAVLQLEWDGVAGPAIPIMLGPTAPALFQSDSTNVLAARLDGTAIDSAHPAHAGDQIVLWATGLGLTIPAALPNLIPTTAAPLAGITSFQVTLNGNLVDPRRVLYAGAAPGYAGLFQINLHLPDDTPNNPELRVGTSDLMSPAHKFLPVQ